MNTRTGRIGDESQIDARQSAQAEAACCKFLARVGGEDDPAAATDGIATALGVVYGFGGDVVLCFGSGQEG